MLGLPAMESHEPHRDAQHIVCQLGQVGALTLGNLRTLGSLDLQPLRGAGGTETLLKEFGGSL